jgi:hypothetical protein
VEYLERRGTLLAMKYLVEEYGEDMHAREDYALRLASLFDHSKLVEYLESKGAFQATQ